MGLLQGRLDSLIGASSGYVESLPKPIHDRVNALRAVQGQHTELETQFHKELYELEKKFSKLYEPLYKRRADIVNGIIEPTPEEIEKGAKIEAEENEPEEGEQEKSGIKEESSEGAEAKNEAAESKAAGNTAKGIPEFWSTALQNHPRLSDLITERDTEALKFLTNISLQYLDGGDAEQQLGFKLIFEFSENPFFENSQLVKTYYYTLTDDPGNMTFHKAEGTEIKWKPDHDLTVTTETKKQRHKATNRTRVIKRTVPAETFFSFFDTITEEQLAESPEMPERVEAEYDLGEEFKEQIIPHAIDWFTGKALSRALSESEFDDEYYDGGFDDEDFEDGEDDNSDGSSDEVLSRSAQNEQPPQCKQQ
ncbi:histone chaperone [Spiromyces aspiralis]|uniref:Histone chaperone n=1 Tax=Spiromyces aspiralis TaxID=68401 RepID=A0ACC1HD33_9FUNG|nr:histone chaperone [Spiromyces aspiralis]